LRARLFLGSFIIAFLSDKRFCMDQFNFAEIRKKITSYLDHDMSPEDQDSFLTQIQKDPNGQSELIRERLIRSKIRENIHRPHLSPGLVDRIKNKIVR